MADLQKLFASLKSPSSEEPSSQSSTAYHQPTVSSPIFSPSPSGPQPHHSSAIMSPNIPTPAPNTTGADQSGSDRTASLLNLLRFSQPGQTSSTASQASTSAEVRPSHNVSQNNMQGGDGPAAQNRAFSASDLVATFMRKPSGSMALQSPPIASPAPMKPELHSEASTSVLETPQDLLLKLLNQAKPPQAESRATTSADVPIPSIESKAPEATVDDLAQDLEDAKLEKVDSSPKARKSSPIRIFGSPGAESTPFEPPAVANQGSIFTYVNPFEQLSASSPRNRTPKPEGRSATAMPKIEILKHARDSSAGAPSTKARKLAAGSPHAATAMASSPPSAQPRETVSEALGEVGERVDKQVEEALARVDEKANGTVQPAEEISITKAEVEEAAEAMHEAAVEIKQELEDPEIKRVVEEAMPAPMAEAFEAVIDEIAQENVADSWESADGEDSPGKDTDFVVRVFNFPMRPFVSIDIKKLHEPPTPVRQDIMVDVSRMKKDFDQTDRTLVTATKNFIAYALPKHGGVRLVSQDSGQAKAIFQSHQERIFNVALCTRASAASPGDAETVLGTGINGSVFWTTIMSSRDGSFSEDNLDDRGFVFPPVPAHDDNTSGGQLKTRAKKSSRHPEFFAIGRGKAIHVVWPEVARTPAYTNQKTRVCNSEKYFKERSLKIVTGKAGKDFAFSEDDTVIVSLDKAGKMKFWDIRNLINPANGPESSNIAAQEIRTPIMTLLTTSPTDKSWPTSVMFLDKDRPCTKGIALRYLLVGMEQNHSLQLWDLGLGKPVQEINFPHKEDSDAICSIAYHPRTGVVAVGHPTRNSIYFIHLSAPRYNLNPMAQAKYISRLANNDKDLPKPESTAIMSGIREFSFAAKGELRSLDMLVDPANADNYDKEDMPIFELYVMHSKGVVCLGIRREDLGWTEDMKMSHPVDAESKGAIVVKPLRTFDTSAPSEPSVNGDQASHRATAATPSRPTPQETKKEVVSTPSRAPHAQTPEASTIASTLARVESKQDAARAAIINGADKAEKKKKKRSALGDTASQVSASTATTSAPSNPALVTPQSYALAARRAKSPSPSPQRATTAVKDAETTPAPTTSDTDVPAWTARLVEQIRSSMSNVTPASAPVQDVKGVVSEITSEFSNTLSQELKSLYRKFDEDRRVQDAAGAAKQDAVLRLVSSTLSNNVEKALARIIAEKIQAIVLPTMTNVITATLDRRLTEILSASLMATVPKEVKEALPLALTSAMADPEVLRIISDLVSSKVTANVDTHLSAALHNNITPAFTNLAVSAVQQLTGDVDRRVEEQLRQAEMQRRSDSMKIEQLTNLTRGLSETVHTMAATQADFQAEILKLQRQATHTRDVSTKSAASNISSTQTAQTVATPVKSPEDEELETITRLMTEGSYETGTIMWVQSPRQIELFDRFFVRVNPDYLSSVSPLVALSVGAAVTATFDKNAEYRLFWLETIFNLLNPKDPEIVEVCPKILEVLAHRLQAAYMQIADSDPTSPLLRKMSSLARRAQEMRAMVPERVMVPEHYGTSMGAQKRNV